VVLDPGAHDAGVEVVAELVTVLTDELSAEEGRHVGCLHGVDGGADDRLVERGEVSLPPKDDVGGVLDLHEAPVVAELQRLDDRAAEGGVVIKNAVELVDVEVIGEPLSCLEVLDVHEGVVDEAVGDAGLIEPACEHVVAVEVDLQAEGAPRGHADVAKAELRVDEVEVVVEATAGPELEERLVGVLVVPGPVRRAGLHRREDVDQARVVTATIEHLLDEALLADLGGRHELDLDAVLVGEPLGVLADLVAQRLGVPGVVEDADLVSAQPAGHAVGVAEVGEDPLDDDAIEAGDHASDLVLVPLYDAHAAALRGSADR